jgi:hypothetical protein
VVKARVWLWVLVCCVGNIVLNILFPLLGVSVVVLSVVLSVVRFVVFFVVLFFFFLLVESCGAGKWGLQEGDYDDATASAELHAKSIALSAQVNTSYNVMQQDVSRPKGEGVIFLPGHKCGILLGVLWWLL